MLVDGSGIIRAEYRTATPDMAIIERDINLLLEEAENIDGPSRYAYEAAHLFLCYPR
jgi:protein SCO1/2